MYKYRLTQIILNDDTALELGNLTVIVGPNNAGKSRALKEIVQKATTNRSLPDIVIKDVQWTLPESLDDLRKAYNIEHYMDELGNWFIRTLVPELCSEYQTSGSQLPTSYASYFIGPGPDRFRPFADIFGKSMLAFLTTEHRLQLVKESSSPSHEKQVANLLQALYGAGKLVENTIRTFVKRAFDKEVALDFTMLGKLLLRVGNDFSTLPLDPRDAKSILAPQEKLDDQGDGIRSFVGIVVALLALKRSVFLIDEPEAFLHPPQAFRIGEFLANQATNTRQIILATHSADLLRGILSKTQDVAILRIDRLGNSNSFRLLNPERLKDVDLHFVNADNKQTVPRIMKVYRDMGVRCAGIVDFDVLNNHAEFEKQLEALELNKAEIKEALGIQGNIAQVAKAVPPEERLESLKQQMTELLVQINTMLNCAFSSNEKAISAKERLLRQIESRCRELADSTKGWKKLKQQGRNALPPEIQSEFDFLWIMCAKNGLFINPCGELESMLTEYGIPPTTDKRAWITQALQLLPNLEINDERYPWKFVKAIHEQLAVKDTNKDLQAS